MNDLAGRSRYRIPPGEPAQLLNYAEQIEVLAKQCLVNPSKRGDRAILFNALGVMHVDLHGTWRLIQPLRPNALFSDLVLDTLVRAMRFVVSEDCRAEPYAGGASVLSGIVSGTRSPDFFTTLDDAYYFVLLLLSCAKVYPYSWSSPAFNRLRNEVSCHAGAYLTQWLKPIVPFQKIPQGAVLAEALFGAAWCSLMLDTDRLDGWEVGLVIMHQRPPFLPGLLPAALEASLYQSTSLPLLEY